MVFNSSLALGGEIYEEGRIVRAGATRMTWSFLMNSSVRQDKHSIFVSSSSSIRESPPQIDNRIMAPVHVRSITRSTIYQNAPSCSPELAYGKLVL